jgi:glutathione S-transferase
VWDSLAIAEWAAEHRPALWPGDAATRAACRSAVAEMHSGFAGIRRDYSMNIRRRVSAPPPPEDTRADLERLFELWGALRARYAGEGPWLFGARTIADAFYAPVATRLRTYGVPTPPDAQAWCDTLLADPDFRAWEAAAEAEPWRIETAEALYA